MLVKEGVVLEWMQGQYDSYGRVFKVETKGLGPHCGDEASYLWTAMDWGDIVSLHYNGCSYSGIAAYHSGCFDGDMENVTVSNDDPEQGWGTYLQGTRSAIWRIRSLRGLPRGLTTECGHPPPGPGARKRPGS